MGVKDNIEHIDTNIIVRLIARDNPKQVKRAEKLLSKPKIYVFEDAAMMEVVFVLAGPIYHLTREQIASGIKSVMLIPNLFCNKSIIEGALDVYVSHPKLSFVDCYLAVVTDTTREAPLWTFDRKLVSQFPLLKEP